MKYTSLSNIKSVDEVKCFFDHLLNDLELNFHPDDDFQDYVLYVTREPMFTEEDAFTYNRLMDESFDICEKQHVDIYELGLKMLSSYMSKSVA